MLQTNLKIKENKRGPMKIKKISRLLEKKEKTSGRNNLGKITVKHRGGEHKRKWRKVDFKRNLFKTPATILQVQRDPNRTANIALVCYPGGILSYILAPEDILPAAQLYTTSSNPTAVGTHTPLKNVLIGSFIFNLEIRPGSGGKLIRSAGTYGILLSKDVFGYVQIKLPSGETKKFQENCHATLGVTSNTKHHTYSLTKAGQNRHIGVRPHVRGVAMNPVDHPHGGGEGKHGTGRPSVSFSGILTKGKKTRKNKKSNFSILKKRYAS